MITRRNVLAATSVWWFAPAVHAEKTQQAQTTGFQAFADLERSAGGRLGVAVLDTGNGKCISHRADERFSLCSTFKLSLAAAVLQAVDQQRMQLTQWVAFGKAALVSHSPVLEQQLVHGVMTVQDLLAAVLLQSDNAAANLLLQCMGGPPGLTQFWRNIGDEVTRIDRWEPGLNQVPPGDARDTTSPLAMAHTVARITTTEWLQTASRTRLVDWLVESQTGAERLRVGFPADWRAGDRTGTATDMGAGVPDKYNDIAIAWRPRAAPLVVTAYYEAPPTPVSSFESEQAVLAEVGRIAAAWGSQRGGLS